MIDVHYASLTSQRVQHRVFYRDGHPSRYQPRPTGLNFGEQTGTGVFPLVIAVPLRRNQDRYPLAAETVLNSAYMDDSIDSVENDKEGVKLYRQLKALRGAANMQARKWISNSPEVMEKIPAEERATEIVIDGGQDPITKTLGIS